MSFQVFNVGGSSKSSHLESRECINKLPVSCRKCVDKLPLNISSPLSYAREKTLSLWSEILVVLMMASGNSIIFISWVPSRRVLIPKLVIDHVLLAFRICTCKKSKRVMRTTAWNIVNINQWHTYDHVTIKHRPTVWKFYKFVNFIFQLSKHANFDRLWRFSHFGFRSGFR